MSSARSDDRQSRHSGQPNDQDDSVEPAQSGGPDEAAHYIAEASAELAGMARRHGLKTLGPHQFG
jgi:hypothetical protein